MFSDGGHVVAHRGVAHEVEQLEFMAPLAQELLQGEHKRGMDALNALALQGLAVVPQPGQVRWQEGHLPSQLLQQTHLGDGGLAAGIPIGPRRGMVEHQHPPHDPPVFAGFGCRLGWWARWLEGVLPLALKQRRMFQLQALAALRVTRVDAAGCALVVDHPGEGGTANAQLLGSYLEGQVGVLEVGRGKVGAEPPQLLPHRQPDGQAGGAHVIHLAGVAGPGVVGIATAPVIPGLAIAPHNPSRLLQSAVGKDQLGAGDPRIRPQRKGRQEFLQPAGTGLGVVVEQHHKRAPGQGHAALAGLVETLGLVMAHQANTLQIPVEGLAGAVGAAVVHHDQLHRDPGRGVGDRQQAAAGDAVVVMGRDYHRHQGSVAAGQLHRTLQRHHRAGWGVALDDQPMQAG